MGKRVLVVGDIIVDRYSDYRFKKMCPDRPGVPAYVRTKTDVIPGGAANVAANLAELASRGGSVHLIGAATTSTLILIKSSTRNRLGLSSCYTLSFPLDEMVKERMRVDGDVIMRIDTNERYIKPVVDGLVETLSADLSKNRYDSIVVSDYGSGFGPRALELINFLAPDVPVFLDTKITDMTSIFCPYVLKLNRQEYDSIGMTNDRPPEFFCQNCVVTAGADGADLIVGEMSDAKSYRTSRVRFPLKLKEGREVVDVTGCGDTFLAGLTYWMTWIDDDIGAAVQFANACASSVVGEFGTACVKLGDVEHLMRDRRIA